MKEIKTSSGTVFYYNTRTNTIQTTPDDSQDSLCTKYYLNDIYKSDQISMFTIEVTQQCNLRCKYCCYSGEYDNRRKHSSKELTYDSADKIISFIEENFDKDAESISVCFYGGEALLARDKVNYIISQLLIRCPHVPFEFTISSNGTTLSKSVLLWINTIPNLKVTITIDGDKEMHDKNRIFPLGKGSYETIMNNLSWYKKEYEYEFERRIQFIATAESIEAILKLNDFWINNPIIRTHRPLHISSIIPNTKKGVSVVFSKHDFQLVFDKALQFYKDGEQNLLTDELKKLIGPVNFRNYSILPKEQRLSTCINNPYSCFISCDGKLYACERFCEQYSFGDIENGINLSKCRDMNSRYLSRKKTFCSKCWAQRLCRICATILNNDEHIHEYYCENERYRISMALKYYCELKEYKSAK